MDASPDFHLFNCSPMTEGMGRLHPHDRPSDAHSAQTVQVNISTEGLNDHPQRTLNVIMPVPITHGQLSARVVEKGYNAPQCVIVEPQEHILHVTEGPSEFVVGRGGVINLDQPLLHYYHNCYVPVKAQHQAVVERKHWLGEPPPSVNEAQIRDQGNSVQINGLKLSFRRTIRVPDNEKTHALPPDLGPFEIFNVADVAHRAPQPVVSKGGVFICMYQREAMWINFETPYDGALEACAVKISVGGINAITGLSQDAPSNGKQDYLVINGFNGQRWLDGIATAPDVIRQFVAMPLGKGYTVEGQMTGKEDIGGMQIDVYRKYATTVAFRKQGTQVDFYRTPRQLGMSPHSTFGLSQLAMTDLTMGQYLLKRRMCLEVSDIIGPKLNVFAYNSCSVYINDGNGKTKEIPYDPCETWGRAKAQIQIPEGPRPSFNDTKFLLGEKTLDEKMTMWDLGIRPGSTINLVQVAMKPRARAPPMSKSFKVGQSATMGLAPGGQIAQKIYRDKVPPIAYDQTNPTRLHVSIVNSADFQSMTGRSPPQTPITTQTYLEQNLPWYTLYEENIPSAVPRETRLWGLKSVAGMAADGRQEETQPQCGYCNYEMATFVLQPCGHLLCDDCAAGLGPTVCPVEGCATAVCARKRFAVGMPMPGREEHRGVEANSGDDRIVRLGKYKGKNVVGTFVSTANKVSPLGGAMEMM